MKHQHHTIRFANWLEKLNDWSSIFTMTLATTLFVIVVVLLLSLKRRKFLFFNRALTTKANLIKNHTNKKSVQNHYWYYNDLFTKPTYCNICEGVMVSGVSCIYCNLYADEKCLKRAEKMFKCKQMCECVDADSTTSTNNSSKESSAKIGAVRRSGSYTKAWQHHWIKGNLKLNSVCFFCNEDSGVGPNLNDFKCAWCQRTAHEKCLNSVSTVAHDDCDFGDFKRLMLKPNFLFLRKKQSTNITLEDISVDRDIVNSAGLTSDWTPLFVFANPKSGNNDADLIVSHMTTILNPLQIIEINKKNLEMVLKWMEEYSDIIQFKLMVCGGDGSVGWLLESISKYKFKKYEPSIAILPLGTGNDLSRALKWGEGYLGDVDIEDVLYNVDKARLIKLDRWQVKIEKLNTNSKKPGSGDLLQLKFMNNYISVGCDALVTLNFHRERNMSWFSNRLFNKLIYFKYGTIDTFVKECRNLTESIEIELDGKKIDLPHLESIVVLNIPFWGGGVQPWNNGKTRTDIPELSINDGRLEVFGIYSSFHIAQLQVGLAEPFRIGQARNVQLRLKKRFPVQIDGEPWEQNPAVINISAYNQATMLESLEES